MKEFTQTLEKTTDFTFTTERGNFVTLSVMKGSKWTANKKKPRDYWMCELNVKGIDLQRNVVYYPEIDGCEEEDEMVMHLDGENPICYCENEEGKTIAIYIPSDIAELANNAIHEELFKYDK